MRLAELLAAAGLPRPAGQPDPEVTGVSEHSASVRPGWLFVAIPGSHDDGARWLPQALANGAVAVALAESVRLPEGAAVARVPLANPRLGLALLASAFHGHPARSLRLAAVTGTKGKTTTAFLIHRLMEAAWGPSGLLGTVHNLVDGEPEPARLTTLPASELQALLARMRDAGRGQAVLELSSHALDQQRAHGLEPEWGLFTNLSPDHQDYHPDLESYFAAKLRLFQGPGAAGRALANIDDAWGRRLLELRPDAVGYGRSETAAVRLLELEVSRAGLRLVIGHAGKRLELDSPLLGRFNASNVMAAVAWALTAGIDSKSIERAVSGLSEVPGRMQRVPAPDGVLALVDFAHTGPALEATLGSLRELTERRLIVVFGAGGDRDPERRRRMGEVAARSADLAVITSDNPRSEDPQAIVAAIEQAARSSDGGAELLVEPDRAAAITLAVRNARAGDTLVVAGKGHERFQLVAGERRPFDDREQLQSAFERERGAA